MALKAGWTPLDTGSPGATTCPHCQAKIPRNYETQGIGKDADGDWWLVRQKCPACDRWEISLLNGRITPKGNPLVLEFGMKGDPESVLYLVHPQVSGRSCPGEVPKALAKDFQEACGVLGRSPNASGALSRRCLQHLLREHAGVKQGNLDSEIQQVLDSSKLPSDLAGALDAVRVIGNFAAHPIKSTSTGEIVDVEPGEAEWNLDTLEELFDFYFVRPAKLKAKHEALNKKLQDAGKPPLKK